MTTATQTIHTSTSVLAEYQSKVTSDIKYPDSFMVGGMSMHIADLRNENARLKEKLATLEKYRPWIANQD